MCMIAVYICLVKYPYASTDAFHIESGYVVMFGQLVMLQYNPVKLAMFLLAQIA